MRTWPPPSKRWVSMTRLSSAALSAMVKVPLAEILRSALSVKLSGKRMVTFVPKLTSSQFWICREPPLRSIV